MNNQPVTQINGDDLDVDFSDYYNNKHIIENDIIDLAKQSKQYCKKVNKSVIKNKIYQESKVANSIDKARKALEKRRISKILDTKRID